MLPGRVLTEVLGSQRDGAGVALGLLQRRRHVDGLLLGFDHADAGQAYEKRIIRRSALGRPFGDGPVAALLRPCALGVAQLPAIGLPAHLVELHVDEAAGVGLVQLQLRRGLTASLDEGDGFLLGLGRRGGLEPGQLLSKAGLRGLLLAGKLLPRAPILPLALDHLVRGGPGPRLLLRRGVGFGCLRLRLADAPTQGLQFLGELAALPTRVGRRNEGAGLESGIPRKGLVEPHPQGTGELEAGESLVVSSRQIMDRHIPALADGVEDVAHLPRNHPLRREALEHVLELLPQLRTVGAGAGRDLLQQGLGELAALDKGGIGVLGEESLGQKPKAKQLLADRSQMIEVRRPHAAPLGAL
jgi:hypothetical protein